MYARNVATFLAYIVKDGKLQLNLQDEIIRETMVTHGGEIVNARVREFFKLPALGRSNGCKFAICIRSRVSTVVERRFSVA